MNWKSMKKIAGIMLSCVLIGSLMGGCGSSGQKPAGDAPTRIGVIKNLNVSEEQRAELIKKAGERSGAKFTRPFSFTYYDSLMAMMLGLHSKSIDEMSTYKSVANFLMARNSEFAPSNFTKARLTDSFCCALRQNNTELLAAINKVLTDMKKDGTMERLTKEYVTDIPAGTDPPAVTIAKFEGSEPLKVAVTGDLPPIDLVLADGTPAGFNTAVLAEVGKRLERTIDLVTIEGGARASALTSGRVDVVFWTVVPVDEFDIRPANMDKPEGIETTVPYYQDDIVHIVLKEQENKK